MRSKILLLAQKRYTIWYLIFANATISISLLFAHSLSSHFANIAAIPVLMSTAFCGIYGTFLRSQFIYYSRYIQWGQADKFDWTKLISLIYGAISFVILFEIVYMDKFNFVHFVCALSCLEVGHTRFISQLLENPRSWGVGKKREISNEAAHSLMALEKTWNIQIININR